MRIGIRVLPMSFASIREKIFKNAEMGNVFFWISKDICTKDKTDFSQKKKSIVLFYLIWGGCGF